MRVLVIGGVARSLVNFRGQLLAAMVARGHQVWACAGDANEAVASALQRLGVRYSSYFLDRAGRGPLSDLRTLIGLWRTLRLAQPDVVLTYTAKPVIWGGIAARLAGTPAVYSLISGLGYAFSEGEGARRRLLNRLVAGLYRGGLSKSHRVFFQNPDDLSEFTSRGVISSQQAVLVPGSGVDLSWFSYSAVHFGPPRFLMVARLLAEKGVYEYARAAREIRSASPEAVFRLVGGLDPNPASISRDDLGRWCREGGIEYLGELDDVRPAYADCTAYVLPSYYREGIPRTILEAMATGRAIITTDSPGCRETVAVTSNGSPTRTGVAGVREGENGLLVAPRDWRCLAEAMRRLIQCPDKVERMGRRSRELAEQRFDVHIVNRMMLGVMGL